MAGAVLATLAAFATTGALLKGLPQRMPDYQVRQIAEGGNQPWLNGRCFLMNQDASAWAGQECVRTRGASENALLWGDSFAAHYIAGLLENQDQLTHNVVQYTFAGCPPVLNYRSFARPGCEGFNQRVFDVIRTYDIKVVIIAARWDQLRQRGLSGLSETIARIQAAGPKVYVIAQSPMFSFDTSVLAYRKAGFEGNGRASWYFSFDPHIIDRLKEVAGTATLVDPVQSFCAGKHCDYMREDNLLFDDYGHFSPYGSDLAVRTYFPTLRRPLREVRAQNGPETGDGARVIEVSPNRTEAGAVRLGAASASR